MTASKAHACSEDEACQQFLGQYSIEIIPRDTRAAEMARRVLSPGTEIYLASVSGEPQETVIARALELRTSGFVPVPHVVARRYESHNQLETTLARLQEAGVDRALLLGGDVARVVGPFPSSRAVLETGLFARYGFERLGFATYPQPHPHIPTDVLDDELGQKVSLTVRQGMTPWVVSQVCFEPDAIAAHIRRLRARGIADDVRVGLAGPATLKSVMRLAHMCGVTNSAQALRSLGQKFGRLVVGYEPQELIDRLLHDMETKAELRSLRGHFFGFGGLEQTATWIREYRCKGRRRRYAATAFP
ncbi:hypothetical protein [Bradyrhizobium sp. CCGUVB23]|uniref:hypothetical protein n=1 Tax=Bradyrhizobium sp. CCGUVB23 TaxID=2949630 RepID=UPI0020B44003|nr:hypothetical protein [Bradyrhizobium sp. CCGUVB23]MCP3460482.1 hypothetical protein [Bradyrhizobium sp. CCGUVB23]